MVVFFCRLDHAAGQPFVTDHAGVAALLLKTPFDKIGNFKFLRNLFKTALGHGRFRLRQIHPEHNAGDVKDRGVGAAVAVFGIFDHAFKVDAADAAAVFAAVFVFFLGRGKGGVGQFFNPGSGQRRAAFVLFFPGRFPDGVRQRFLRFSFGGTFSGGFV